MMGSLNQMTPQQQLALQQVITIIHNNRLEEMA